MVEEKAPKRPKVKGDWARGRFIMKDEETSESEDGDSSDDSSDSDSSSGSSSDSEDNSNSDNEGGEGGNEEEKGEVEEDLPYWYVNNFNFLGRRD